MGQAPAEIVQRISYVCRLNGCIGYAYGHMPPLGCGGRVRGTPAHGSMARTSVHASTGPIVIGSICWLLLQNLHDFGLVGSHCISVVLISVKEGVRCQRERSGFCPLGTASSRSQPPRASAVTMPTAANSRLSSRIMASCLSYRIIAEKQRFECVGDGGV